MPRNGTRTRWLSLPTLPELRKNLVCYYAAADNLCGEAPTFRVKLRRVLTVLREQLRINLTFGRNAVLVVKKIIHHLGLDRLSEDEGREIVIVCRWYSALSL